MKNIVINSRMNQISVIYDGVYFRGKEKGIKIVQEYRNPYDLSGTVREFVLGKNVRNKIRIGCASRCWTNPFTFFDEQKEEQDLQLRRIAEEGQKRIAAAKEKEAILAEFTAFIEKPTRQGWENLNFHQIYNLDLHVQVKLLKHTPALHNSYSQDPKQETRISALKYMLQQRKEGLKWIKRTQSELKKLHIPFNIESPYTNRDCCDGQIKLQAYNTLTLQVAAYWLQEDHELKIRERITELG